MSNPQKRVLAAFDEHGVWVYQAFRIETVQEAVRLGTFGKGFSLDRMTWIKPSFGWMLHRSGYATKHRQEAIARIHITHAGFLAILRQAIPTSADTRIFETESAWQAALNKSDVRYQRDPDRDLRDYKLDRRAIQLGIRGETVRRYASEWILRVEDVTGLAHSIRDAASRSDADWPAVPVETEYPVPPEIALTLAMINLGSRARRSPDRLLQRHSAIF